jgi:hypothetical protein
LGQEGGKKERPGTEERGSRSREKREEQKEREK